MRPVLAALDLLALLGSGGAAIVARSRPATWVLLIASGLWLPLNNAVLEGPVLLTVSHDHGLTVSDLLGVGGATLAGFRLWRTGRRSAGRPGRGLAVHAALVALVVLTGFLAAMLDTDLRVEDLPAGAGTHARHHHENGTQRSSFDIRRSASSLPPV